MGWLGQRRGCTWWPDQDFGACCIQHDEIYRTRSLSRRAADRQLRQCITRHGHPVQAWVIWLAVRLFGWIFWGGRR